MKLIHMDDTWAAGHRRAHVHETEGTAWKWFATSRATGDLWLCRWTTDPILAEPTALVWHRWTAVWYRLSTEVTAHKHLKTQSYVHKQKAYCHQIFISSQIQNVTCWKTTWLKPVQVVSSWDPVCFYECQIQLVYAKTSRRPTSCDNSRSNTVLEGPSVPLLRNPSTNIKSNSILSTHLYL